MNRIDWARLAEPQADQYDTEAILRLAPAKRTPVGGCPSVFDGQVGIRYACRSLPEFELLSAQYPDGPTDHPNIGTAAEYVRRWPIVFTQCQRLLNSIHPAIDPQIPLESSEIYRGSICHSFKPLFGTVWATIFCPFGLAEAIVREMAHQKLFALGEMAPVLHDQYSNVHVTALDIHMLRAERDAARREALFGVLQRNLSRIEEDRDTARAPGAFMDGFRAWTERTVCEGRGILGIGARTAAKTMPSVDTRANTIVTPDREVEILLTFNEPRIVLLGNVLSDDECDALAEYAEPRMARSSVIGDENGNVKTGESRTSRGVMLRRRETAMAARIEARLAALANWPIERSEGLQILRYGPDGEYKPHFDWMDPALPGLRKYLAHGGQRLATFVLYLSDVESGGGTAFPAVGLEVKPRKGGAVFFLNTDSQHVPDQLTLHAGNPIITGVKFVANKWLRQTEC